MAANEPLDWDDLRHLLAAGRAGTLAGAGRALGVEHTTVARRLQRLERALGGALVIRRPDGLALTPLGRRVCDAAGDVECRVAQVRDAARQAARIRVALPSGCSSLFAAQLHRLRDADPPVALELSSGAQKVDLARGDAELAVRSGPVDDPDLVARPLCPVGWSLFASRGYLERRAWRADALVLEGHDVIGYEHALAGTAPARWLALNGAGARTVMRGREMVDMADAALAGVGLALLPCHLAAPTALVRLVPEVLAVRELWLVYQRESRQSAAVRAAIRFIVEVMEAAAPVLLGADVAADAARDRGVTA